MKIAFDIIINTNMSRASKSSSFLDELLGSESLGGGDIGKRSSAKSVRFIDNDDNDILGSIVPKPGSSASGSRKSTVSDRSQLDWLESDSRSISSKKPASPNTPKTGRADWLGLGNDDDEDSVNDSRFLQSKPPKPSDEDSSGTGLNTRRQKQQLSENVMVESGMQLSTTRGGQDSSWLDIKKSLNEKNEPQTEDQPIIRPVAQRDVQSTDSASSKPPAQAPTSSIAYESQQPTQSILIGHVPLVSTGNNIGTMPADSSHLMLLQTQVSYLISVALSSPSHEIEVE